MTKAAFGPNLKRIRISRCISLDTIAEETKVGVELWEAMERNDFSRWPKGIFARAYIREYARLIGLEPDATVDEFCRWFPQGDRRAERTVREHAHIVGHQLVWADEVPPAVDADRRAGASEGTDQVPAGVAAVLLQVVARVRRAFARQPAPETPPVEDANRRSA